MENRINLENGIYHQSEIPSQSSNPWTADTNLSNKNLSEYSQILKRPKYDTDIAKFTEIARILNNLAPIRLPVYNFKADEINGDRYRRPDGTLLLIREYDSDVIRDYYYDTNPNNPDYTINRILEHDRTTGRLRAKIEPIIKEGRDLKINVAIFDKKVNNKYTILQLSSDGIVNNISEFTGNGKSFQTLFRNTQTFKPIRYIEGKEDKETGFIMVDCLFTEKGDIARIKQYTKRKEICVDYTDTQKHISVKNQGNYNH